MFESWSHFLRSLGLASLGLVLAVAPASANGRPPAGLDIRVRSSQILVSTTFGIVQSQDNGGEWTWMCEASFGTGGVFDPDFELSTRSSTIFTTAIEGMLVTRDGCVYQPSALGERFISSIAMASNGDFFAAASDGEGSKIYRSTDDGVTFAQASNAFRNYDTWRGMEVAPSDPSRIYLSGLRVVFGMPKQYLMYRSTDAGKTFTATPLTGFTGMSAETVIFIAGVSATNPDLVFARLTAVDGTTGEAIYRSSNGGDTWTQILAKPEPIAFLVRKNGELIAGTDNSGTVRSVDGGTTFTAVDGAPHLLCLYEDSAATIYGCTQNYGGDAAAVMTSTDGLTWTKTVRFQDISAPTSCAAGTMQQDYCVAVEWCGLKEQLGIASNAIKCAPGSGTDGGGCCDADGSSSSTALLGLPLGMLLWFSRRRRSARARA
ncbi:MAG: hypothetical protein IPI49_16600 [Myxococcales bacterium]|nr:hypothetical protein [Myxococcales bacterium]